MMAMPSRNWWTLAALLAVWGCGQQAGWGAGPVRARIERTSGTVKVRRGGVGDWLVVTANAHRNLYAGDHVITLQRSKATILSGGVRWEMGPRSHVKIAAARNRPSGAVARLGAIAGQIFTWLIGTRSAELGSEGAIAAAHGTKFLLEVDEETSLTRLTVLEGEVDFYNSLGAVTVQAGEQSTATPTSAPTRPMRVDPSGYLEWEASLDGVGVGWETRYSPQESAARLQELAQQAVVAAQAAPTDAAAQMKAGDALNDAGETAASEQAYRRAVELAPGSLEARLRLGMSLLGQWRRTEAQEVFAQAAALAPGDPYPVIGQAACLASSADPANLAPAEQMLDKAAGMATHPAVEDLVRGVLDMREGNAEEAAAAFGRAIAGDGSCYQAYAYLATVQLAQKDPRAALGSAQKAVEIAPASGLAHEALGTVQFFAGDLKAARREVQLALAGNPSSATAHLLASDIAVAEGRVQEGEDEAQLAVALDPLLAPAYCALGMIALSQSDLKHAERDFTRALELSPKLVAARTGMGVTYQRQGKLAAGMESQKASVALDSSNAAIRNNYGCALLAHGELDEAVAQLKAASALQPRWGMPHANLALAYLDLNRFAEAVAEGELAVRLGESSARLHTTLARVYLKQNRAGKAWASLRRAVELDPNYALAHLELAEVYTLQGRPRDALKHQFRAVSLQPSAILETRDYARTEVQVEAGSFDADLRTDGRGDDGQNSYFFSADHQNDSDHRTHSNFNTTSALGIVGRQTAPQDTNAVIANLQSEHRERPGREIGGAPDYPDYTSRFTGTEAHYMIRRPVGSDASLTVKLGYRDSFSRDMDPGSMMGADANPFPTLDLEYRGPLAEVRVDAPLSDRTGLVAGAAYSGERRNVSGMSGMPNPSGPPGSVVWTHFDDGLDRHAATYYLDVESQLSPRTRLLVGGLLATAQGMNPVLRPRVSLRHTVGNGGTLVLLTRPILRDDVSEISPVDDWALRDWLSPLSLDDGGLTQSYELQYELMPPNGSLLRLSGFYRTLRNYLVDLQDPAWAAGQVGNVLGGGSLRGGELEWEHWLGRDLSGGVWVRYTSSRNDDMGGRDIPYIAKVTGQARLDYMDPNGMRASVVWLHVGPRHADLNNATRLGSYNQLNLYLARQCNLHTELFVGASNLFDQRAGFWQGYPDQGRAVKGGVLYRF